MNYKLLRQLGHEQDMGENFCYYMQLFESVKFLPVDEVELDTITNNNDEQYEILNANNSDGPDVVFWFKPNDILLSPAFATFVSFGRKDFY